MAWMVINLLCAELKYICHNNRVKTGAKFMILRHVIKKSSHH